MRKPSHVPCPECGDLMQAKSVRCQNCHRQERNRCGASNPNWKGGRYQNGDGYILVHDPTLSRGSDRYVMEHVLVMTDHIGRPLLPNENVHHKNLQRADNRIENLELWSTHQPTGARVEDLIDWAWEIILRYDVKVS